MIALARALAAHAMFVLCVFGPVVVLGVEAALVLGLPTQLGAVIGFGAFLTWIGARAGQREVWIEGPRR